VRHAGNLARLQQTAAFLEIGHDHIRRALLENLATTPEYQEIMLTVSER